MVDQLIKGLKGAVKSKSISEKNEKLKKALFLAKSIDGRDLSKSSVKKVNKLTKVLATQ